MAESGIFSHSISVDAQPLIRSSDRLEAYSDALFSIIATVMVLPIVHTELPEDEALSSSLPRLILPRVGIYIFTFLLVCQLWTHHVKLFEIIGKVDEFAVLINLAVMMVITFFPFAFTLIGEFPKENLSYQIFTGTIMLLSILRFFMTWHVFRHPKMIRDDMKGDTEQLDKEKTKLYFSAITPFILASFSFFFAFLEDLVVLSAICLILMPFGDFLRAKCVQLYTKCRGTNELAEFGHFVPYRRQLLTETIDKERIEFFSDGVFAIVATLIILDISEENIPTDDVVKAEGSLNVALAKDTHVFLAYAGTFITVGLQWYIHHSLLHYVKEVSKLMMVLNFMGLMCVGLSPMAFKLTSTFEKHADENNNEAIAIQVSSTVILLTSLCQSAVWITALFNQDKRLVDAGKHGGKDHAYMAAKLSVYPFISMFTFFMSLADGFSATIFIGVQISVVSLFILLGLLFKEMRKWSTGRGLQVPENQNEFHNQALSAVSENNEDIRSDEPLHM